METRAPEGNDPGLKGFVSGAISAPRTQQMGKENHGPD